MALLCVWLSLAWAIGVRAPVFHTKSFGDRGASIVDGFINAGCYYLIVVLLRWFILCLVKPADD